VKLCTFTLAPGRSCAQPALKRSAQGLCRFHADAPQRSRNILNARAAQVLLPRRRRYRSAFEFVQRRRRSFRIPRLDSMASLTQTLQMVMEAYESGVFDSGMARCLLRCLQIPYLHLRSLPAAPDEATQRAEFCALDRSFRDRLRQDRMVKGGAMTAVWPGAENA
jgi:hypothetical protein